MRAVRFLVLVVLAGCASGPVAPPATDITDESAFSAQGLDMTYAAKAVALSLHCTAEDKPHYYEKFSRQANPRADHPAFYGCYDWHSAVHGHWAMLRILHAHPAIPQRAQIITRLNEHLRPEKVAGELAYFKRNPGFEAPYGYGWLLRLASEVRASPLPEARAWAAALRPLEKYLAEGLVVYFGKMNLPMRSGFHSSSAYAMNHAWDYALIAKNRTLQNAIAAKARDFFGRDQTCPLAYEPSSGDFISPCFEEADLMRRVLSRAEFLAWFAKFLPEIDPKLLEPVRPLDKKDYILGHLIGLMYQKATAMRGVASAFAPGDARASTLRAAARKQALTGWELMFDSGYGGTHWLASFAVLYFEPPGANE